MLTRAPEGTQRTAKCEVRVLRRARLVLPHLFPRCHRADVRDAMSVGSPEGGGGTCRVLHCLAACEGAGGLGKVGRVGGSRTRSRCGRCTSATPRSTFPRLPVELARALRLARDKRRLISPKAGTVGDQSPQIPQVPPPLDPNVLVPVATRCKPTSESAVIGRPANSALGAG